MQLGENQKKFVTALRETTMPQCFGNVFLAKDGKTPLSSLGSANAAYCCALGVAVLNFGPAIISSLKLSADGGVKIVNMNDDEKMPFSQIADKIEEDPAGFFSESY